jgi:hypothetical protein
MKYISQRHGHRFAKLVVTFLLLFLLGLTNLLAQDTDQPSTAASGRTQNADSQTGGGDLTKAVQNPVASLISVPIQNFTDFNIGPFARDRNTVLQFQPVIPARISANWNLISRVIVPVLYQPDISQKHLGTFGLGDTNPSFFFSPAKAGKLIWGVGPAFLLPTATDDALGTGKFCIGPTVVALTQPGHWTIGALVNNLFSVAGPSDRSDVNSMTLQYFVNYNLKKGYFLTSQPIISANWNASSGNVWLVPFGGGIARIFKLGPQPVNASVQAYYNAKRPDVVPSPTWQLKFQFALLYPKKPK